MVMSRGVIGMSRCTSSDEDDRLSATKPPVEPQHLSSFIAARPATIEPFKAENTRQSCAIVSLLAPGAVVCLYGNTYILLEALMH
jgi:hypothetical protein